MFLSRLDPKDLPDMRAWLATYNYNLPLLDVVNDPDANDIDARLAALSLGESLDSGYYDAEALADAVSHLWAEVACGIEDDGSEARTELTELLGRAGAYTHILYDEVKQLSPRSAALHLYDHSKRMMDRADMARIARDAMSRVG
ncbi:hypothetical protein KRR38_01765 [Novosphingobium sp. G106]|uniref:hypothetical protein n=1 Tax=Novosphingobium sp. G106 TaxID=2849500 RepID=UPI001C2CF6C3|nr:hypothetical protein [Novosphingobium sp. G106]MBV1686429.1 hypothetical protein [Novosphingobium sp. G106]